MTTTERSRSVWTPLPNRHEPLRESVSTEVCVVGAGIAGLSTAYALARRGRQVVLLEKAMIGAGETGQTTAHLSSALDEGFPRLVRIHGKERARAGHRSHAAAIDQIERWVREEEIGCDFHRLDGYLVRAENASPEDMREEARAARTAGAEVELIETAPVASFSGPSVCYRGQGRFHPLAYLAGLEEAFLRRGGRIHTGTAVEEVSGGSPVELGVTGGHTVSASRAVITTNSPISSWIAIHSKQAPYRTFAIALDPGRSDFPDILLWDTAEPYHYVRRARDGGRSYIIVGGADHKTGQADDGQERFEALERWSGEHIPGVGEVVHRWSGQVWEPMDGLGHIGADPENENVFLSTGDSGHGMTHGTLAGMILPALVDGEDHEWREIYDPSRFRGRAAGTYAQENLNVARQYADWVSSGDVSETGELRPGEGGIVVRNGKRVAAYRDEEGTLHLRTATCRHLGCVVHWNGTERSWDCPCHGSRFAPTGEVLTGPARQDLEPVED